MSNLLVTPELVAAAAADLAGIGSAIGAANAAAGAPTMALLAAGADEVSAAVAAVFSSYAQQYQALSAAAAAFHDQFLRALAAGAGAYAGAEAANVEQQLLNAINAPTHRTGSGGGRWIPRRPAALQTELHLGTVIVPVPQPPQELWIVVGPDDASLGPVHLCPCSAPAKVDQRRQNQHEEQVEHSTPPWTEYTRAVGSGCVRSA